jgi:UDP-N-acetylmuramoyl-tripeptide--D-alanyl-D-alanine ligase
MQLSKSFLTKALPSAWYYYGHEPYQAQNDDLWDKFYQQTDVTVALDSRALEAGEFFIALKGARADGHVFLEDVLLQGACGALIAADRIDLLLHLDKNLVAGKLFVVVQDTREAFIALAKTRRAEITCPVVGITGSVGKTTTKEMLRTILEVAGIPAFVSFKNYNTDLGICYNLLRVPSGVQAVVLEMGINGQGEMAVLADIARPSLAVITLLGHAHVGHLGGTIAGVAHEKRQIFSCFGANGVGIINGDQPLLANTHYPHPVARFGFKTKNHVQARKVQVLAGDKEHTFTTQFTLKWYDQKATVNLVGNHGGSLNNALAAATAAYFLQVPFAAVVEGLEKYESFENRFELKKLKQDRGMLLSDCYNANPENMKAALAAFSQLKTAGQKVVVLGEMFELGDRQDYWHRQVSRALAKITDLHMLIAVGKRAALYAKMLPHAVRVHVVDDWQEASSIFKDQYDAKQLLVLVKGGRSLRLENMVEQLTE